MGSIARVLGAIHQIAGNACAPVCDHAPVRGLRRYRWFGVLSFDRRGSPIHCIMRRWYRRQRRGTVGEFIAGRKKGLLWDAVSNARVVLHEGSGNPWTSWAQR